MQMGGGLFAAPCVGHRTVCVHVRVCSQLDASACGALPPAPSPGVRCVAVTCRPITVDEHRGVSTAPASRRRRRLGPPQTGRHLALHMRCLGLRACRSLRVAGPRRRAVSQPLPPCSCSLRGGPRRAPRLPPRVRTTVRHPISTRAADRAERPRRAARPPPRALVAHSTPLRPLVWSRTVFSVAICPKTCPRTVRDGEMAPLPPGRDRCGGRACRAHSWRSGVCARDVCSRASAAAAGGTPLQPRTRGRLKAQRQCSAGRGCDLGCGPYARGEPEMPPPRQEPEMRRWAPPSSARMMLVPLPMLTGGTGTRSGPCAPRPGFWLGTRAGGSVLSPCAQHDVAAQTGACELRLGVPCTRPWDVYMAGGAAPLKRESWRAVGRANVKPRPDGLGKKYNLCTDRTAIRSLQSSWTSAASLGRAWLQAVRRVRSISYTQRL